MGFRERRVDGRARNRLIVLLGIVLAAATVLAAGLSNIQLQPGETLGAGLQEAGLATAAGFLAIASGVLRTFWRVFGITMVVLLVPAIIYAIRHPGMLRRALSTAVVLATSLYFLYLFLQQRRGAMKPTADTPTGPPVGLGSGAGITPSAFILRPPQWLTIGVTACLLAAILSIVVAILRRARAAAPASPLKKLAMEAREAIEDLRAGADLRDTVMRCYFEMSRVLDETRGLHREEAMTPREFAHTLKEVGLPGMAVERLTQLFESVRYGAHVSEEREEKDAIACLETIIEACGNLS